MVKNWHKVFYLLPIGIAFLWVFAFPNEVRFGESRKLIPSTSLLVLVSTPFIGYAYSLLKERFKKTPSFWLVIIQFVSLCGSILALTLFDEFFGYSIAKDLYTDFLTSPGLGSYVMVTELPFGFSFSLDVENQFELVRNLWAWWVLSAMLPIAFQWILFRLKKKPNAAV